MAAPDFTYGQAAAFQAIELPAILSRDSTIEFDAPTDIGRGRSRRETRSGLHSTPAVTVNIGPGVRTLYTIRLLEAHFRQVGGPRDAFLFHHFLFHTTGQPSALKTRRPEAPTMLDAQFGEGDGVETEFQICRFYGAGAMDVTAFKSAPLIAIDGVFQDSAVSPAPYTLDTDPATSTGVVTFASPPAGGAVLTWGGTHYIKVRFRDPTLKFDMQNYDRGVPEIILQEVFD